MLSALCRVDLLGVGEGDAREDLREEETSLGLQERTAQHGLKIGTVADLIHFRMVNERTIRKVREGKVNTAYVDDNRIGDHICYISDITKFKSHYPDWQLTRLVDDIIHEMVEDELRKQKETA